MTSEERQLHAHDAGLLGGYGGESVGWWHDYIRAELDRAHDHYAGQHSALLDALDAAEGALEDERTYAELVTCDNADEAADRWLAMLPNERSLNAIASVFAKWAPGDVLDRFRVTLGDRVHLSFVEGFIAGRAAAESRATAAKARVAVLEGALEMIAGQTPHDQTSKKDPGREHYLRTVLINLAARALAAKLEGQGDG